MKHYRTLIAIFFAGIFHVMSWGLIVLAGFQMFQHVFVGENDLISAIIKSINTLVISLAMYELGAGIGKEYRPTGEEENVFQNIRRTITRFVGTACIALVLESLFMIIKYSQLDLAGNLYYPAAIIVACSVLLLALGGFLSLTQHSKN